MARQVTDKFTPIRDVVYAQRMEVGFDFLELPVERQRAAVRRIRTLLQSLPEERTKPLEAAGLFLKTVRQKLAAFRMTDSARQDLFVYSCYRIAVDKAPLTRSDYNVLNAVAMETRQPYPGFSLPVHKGRLPQP